MMWRKKRQLHSQLCTARMITRTRHNFALYYVILFVLEQVLITVSIIIWRIQLCWGSFAPNKNLETCWVMLRCLFVGPNSDTTYNYFTPCFYGQRSAGMILGRGNRLFFCFPKHLWRLRGPPNLLFRGYGVSFLGVKWPGREANHTPPFSAKSKMSGTLPLLLLYISLVWKGKTVPFLWVRNLVSFMKGRWVRIA